MAKDTPFNYRNLVIYQVYVRNHGQDGTFDEVIEDLPRIKSMGVDVVYFMPIHPIGKKNKKGRLGCPFSIADYEGVNPEYGTKEDFKRLVDRAHELELKVMIDVVYNHTSHDSRLVNEHPEWFHQDEDGRPITTVPEWSDVIDLKHPIEDLSDYLVETLKTWVAFGVDGFRCDVASLLPLDFWIRARKEVAKVKKGVIWMAESVHASFVESRRVNGLPTLSDGELYRAFDITYDYDIWPIWHAVVLGRLPVTRYIEMLRLQDSFYPENYVKMRCVENHDLPRIMKLAPNRIQAIAWTAFMGFNKGAFFIYAGQEAAATHTPSLFDIDKIDWGDYKNQDFLTRLSELKKDPAQVNGQLVFINAEPYLQAVWYWPGASLYGVFNTGGKQGQVDVQLGDGEYLNLLGDETVRVTSGLMDAPESAVIFRYSPDERPRAISTDLF
jgi:glycosidase